MESHEKIKDEDRHGPPYLVNIEGKLFPWEDNTITTEEIARTGGWDIAQGVQEIDLRTNETRTLAPGEVVKIQPGVGFAKKLRWQRG